ncbi:hypothetical protein [Salisaeta longa]|uniref:hypothetical protein n=1 Tax=Salisaeta longa TaxID=503170 RepID=UPI0003B77CBA|nr:hypothetical protein [Salisaeta longa]
MHTLVREHIPHAPQMGLYVAPDVPADRLQNAIADYAPAVDPADVLALYDATLSGNAKDGALFTAEGFVFQNTNLQAPQSIGYTNVVEVKAKKRWLGLGGAKVELTVNRGRATFDLSMDFSGQPEAAPYIARFLSEAMLHEPAAADDASTGTDVRAVEHALQALRDEGKLAGPDYERLMRVLHDA